jgi:hypothetical protein
LDTTAERSLLEEPPETGQGHQCSLAVPDLLLARRSVGGSFHATGIQQQRSDHAAVEEKSQPAERLDNCKFA